ncbi:MAG: efflux RND transporter periplasmic adaptor subunit [Candidatus Dadabacteria bacterium]|nr:efflux RND transporter periplasmic adaptor subunit [Candidatus Dadabacteria bacterium]MYA48075.1 efflux RND transporter periplasmic adaptor subunit [Candidatus Dadabacteria bacterium]MYF47452.1 efflux RND transporter periplasmic adaptor subunit [Candidatus Dadabacteria bacterium]MYG83467.1 efflux RND transporter periplasmic adaptor subunit [Candidatus Dadabacteria bacterium]MYK49587.1 efflux RND transporter periplasmic adaptor subunit [Candidatus Dadabacteria bacterium]
MKNLPRSKLLYALAGAIVIAGYFIFFGGSKGEIKYVTQKIERGDITSLVRASGTLKPTKEARIYSQINGTIKEIRAEVNDEVKKGQVLALIEGPEGLSGDVEYFKEILKKTETDLEISTNSHEASKRLYEKELISREEFNKSLSEHSMAAAAREKAQADLDTAQRRLDSTRITSILDGVVLEKNIIIGEQIHPNKSEPLYVLAENPRTLHLVSNVSEADIGKIKEGQDVLFKVDAFPGKDFSAKVKRVANSPSIKNDVVTYDVTCLVENPELELKPGMTAEVKKVISTKKDVLKIPTAALRFIPPKSSAVAAEAGENVWILKQGKPSPIVIETGISDDFHTEVVSGPLSEGDQIVVEYTISGGNNKGPGFALPQPKRF